MLVADEYYTMELFQCVECKEIKLIVVTSDLNEDTYKCDECILKKSKEI